MASFRVPRLGPCEGPYDFTVQEEPDGSRLVLIPGHGGGRDGPTEADYREQEAWMRAESGLEEVWYLTWKAPDDAAYARFRERVDAAAADPA